MIETVAGSVPLGTGVREHDAWRWGYARSTSGVSTWTLPPKELPDGVSMVRVSLAPDGVHRLAFEGNLTAALYGPDAACGSLTADELAPARDALLTRVHAAAGLTLPEASDIRLTRVDPSITLALPADRLTSDVLRQAVDAFTLAAGGRAVCRRHFGTHGDTVTLSHTKARSWSVYDKSAEYARRGKWTPHPQMLRLEARVRPGKVNSGPWKGLTSTLDLSGDLMDAVTAESANLLASLEKVVAAASATGALASVRMLMAGGATVNEAMRLTTAAMIASELGWKTILDMGTPTRTADRWRADFKRYAAAAGGAESVIDDSPALLRAVLGSPVFARDVAAAAPQREGGSEDGGAASGASTPGRRASRTPRSSSENTPS